MKNDTTKQPLGTRVADRRKLQQIMHYHGLKEFLALASQAAFDASDEMEQINEQISEAYRSLGVELAEKSEETEE